MVHIALIIRGVFYWDRWAEILSSVSTDLLFSGFFLHMGNFEVYFSQRLILLKGYFYSHPSSLFMCLHGHTGHLIPGMGRPGNFPVLPGQLGALQELWLPPAAAAACLAESKGCLSSLVWILFI